MMDSTAWAGVAVFQPPQREGVLLRMRRIRLLTRLACFNPLAGRRATSPKEEAKAEFCAHRFQSPQRDAVLPHTLPVLNQKPLRDEFQPPQRDAVPASPS